MPWLQLLLFNRKILCFDTMNKPFCVVGKAHTTNKPFHVVLTLQINPLVQCHRFQNDTTNKRVLNPTVFLHKKVLWLPQMQTHYFMQKFNNLPTWKIINTLREDTLNESGFLSGRNTKVRVPPAQTVVIHEGLVTFY